MTPADDRRRRVEDACAELILTGQPITFDAVADRAQLGRATLYRNAELRALVEEHRARGREAHTLSPAKSLTSAPPSKPSPPQSDATTTNSADSANPNRPLANQHRPHDHTPISSD